MHIYICINTCFTYIYISYNKHSSKYILLLPKYTHTHKHMNAHLNMYIYYNLSLIIMFYCILRRKLRHIIHGEDDQ